MVISFMLIKKVYVMGHMLIGGNLNQIFKPVIQLSSSHKMTEIRTPPPPPPPPSFFALVRFFDFGNLLLMRTFKTLYQPPLSPPPRPTRYQSHVIL